MRLETVLSAIRPAEKAMAEACQARFDGIAKPVGSLGQLEALLAKIAAVQGTPDICLDRKVVVVFCADNGVVRQGVTQSGPEVTTAIARMLQSRKASVCVMAAACGAEVFPMDIGMLDTLAGMQSCKLMQGTNDISKEPAMSRGIAEKAVLLGIETVKDLKSKGFHLIATGEAGIGNTATSAAVCAVLLDKPVEDVTGYGAGLSSDGLRRKIAVLREAIDVNKPNACDSLDVLHKVGGLDIAALTGVFLGGALHHVPIVMDGFIAGVAALLAARLCPEVIGYILPSHVSSEPGARFVVQALGLEPIIHADMRLGEGTGAVALFPLLDMALSVYENAARFGDIQVEPYRRLK